MRKKIDTGIFVTYGSAGLCLLLRPGPGLGRRLHVRTSGNLSFLVALVQLYISVITELWLCL